MNFWQKFLAPFQTALRHSVEAFIRLETADDEMTLAAMDGSLISYLKIDGSRQIIGEEEYKFLVEASTTKIGSKFDRQGHALQVYFVRDPSRVRGKLEGLIKASRITATNIGLDIDDLLEERVKNLSTILSHEECYFVLWTRPSSMTKSELERTAKEKQEQNKKWVNAGYGQNPLAGLEPLRNRHRSFVTSIQAALDELGVRAEQLTAHQALQAVRTNMFPNRANDAWKACMPGDPIPARAPMSAVDLSDII